MSYGTNTAEGRPMLRHPFGSLSRLLSVRSPLLVVHGETDGGPRRAGPTSLLRPAETLEAAPRSDWLASTRPWRGAHAKEAKEVKKAAPRTSRRTLRCGRP